MTLSIIVPSFNTSRFIKRYDNLFYQSELENELEFIFINDGSTDDTGNRLKRLCTAHPGYFISVDKENGGHGSCINLGFRLAKGKYVKLLDGDDELDMSNIPSFLSFLKETNADAVYTKTRAVKAGICSESGPESTLINCCDFARLNSKYVGYHTACYRRTFWIQSNIKVREKVYYDDTQYALYPLEFMTTFSTYPLVIYVYNLDVAGQSVSSSGIRKHFGDGMLVIADELEHYTHLKSSGAASANLFCNVLASLYAGHFPRACIAIDTFSLLRTNIEDFMRMFSIAPEIHRIAKKRKIVRACTFCKCAFLRVVANRLRKQSGIVPLNN